MKPRLPLQPTNLRTAPRCVIYTRVSSAKQGEEGTSLAGQFAACSAKAKDMGAAVTAHYEETKSGGLYESRGELQRALADIEAGRADTLIIYRLDRGGREVGALRDIRKRVERAGAALVFADGAQFEKGAMGNLMFTQVSAFAEFEREMIKERTGSGQQRLAKAGKNPNPTAPYGYHIWRKSDVMRGLCSAEQRGTYTVIEDEAKWVRIIFDRLVSGQSTRSVVKWLEREGSRTRRGTPWSISSLIYLVENSAYIGRPTWRRNQRITDESRSARGLGISYDVPRPEYEQFVFDAPALVSEELWQRANEAVKTGRAERSGRNDARYMLTGLLACPQCGERLQLVHSCANSNDELRRTSMYRCPGAVKRQGEDARQCDFPSVIGSGLEQIVIDALSEFLRSPSIMELSVAEFKKHQQTKAESSKEVERLVTIEREITACRQREEVAARKEVEADIKGQDGAAFASLREESARKRQELESERKRLLARRAASSVAVPEIERDVATRLVAALHSEQIADIDKNALLRPFVRVVYPRLVPSELHLSARAWRSKGGQMFDGTEGRHPFARYMGGCDIVLRFVSEAPAFILSRRIVRWEPGQTETGEKTLAPVFETDMQIEEQSSFPLKWKFRSHLETGRFLS